MGWIGRRLAIVAALTLLLAQLIVTGEPPVVGQAEPEGLGPLVSVQRFATVTGAERTLSQDEFQSGGRQGLFALGKELAPVPGTAGVLTSIPVASPVPFSHVGVRWRGSLTDFNSVRIELRVSKDGSSWTEWREIEVDDDLQVGADGQKLSRLADFDVRGGMLSYAQARLTLLNYDQSTRPSISSLSFSFIDPYEGPSASEVDRLTSTELADGANPLALPKPTVISRTTWGSPTGQYSPDWPPEYRTVTNIIVHHTATSNSAIDWPAEVRAIWYYHAITNQWGDIGYNFLIDPYGRIYEGRAGGDDVVAGHALQYNWGSMGVSFIGDHTYYAPSTPARDSLINLLSWKVDQRGIDPMVLDSYFVDRYLPTIMGHRDALNTTCPGSAAYSLMNSFRTAVRDRLPVSSAPPASSVAPLARFQNHQPFEVTWSGTDSAVSFYVQYRDGPSGDWVNWPGQSPTSGKSATFSAGDGHTYYFRSLAVDGRGTQETKANTQYDAYTTIDITPPSINLVVPPSTTRNWFIINWSASDSTSGIVDNYDVDVSNDGSNWRAWLRGTTGTRALYVNATPGQRYYFKLTGRDVAGNARTVVGGPIVAGPDSSGLSRSFLVQIQKNYAGGW